MASKPHYAEGRYVCEVTGQALGETSSGNAQFVLRFKVIGTPDTQNRDNYIRDLNQYERTFYRAITDKTVPYLIEDLKVLGYTRDSFKFLDPQNPNFHDFSGQVIDMMCVHEEGKDKSGNSTGLRERWSIPRAASAFEVKALEPKKVRELDNLFGKHLKGLKNEAPVSVPEKSSSHEITDDDIPF